MDLIEHYECRRAVFEDLVNFILEEVRMFSHPDYGYAKMTKDKKNSKQVEPKDTVKCRAVNKSDFKVKVNKRTKKKKRLKIMIIRRIQHVYFVQSHIIYINV